MISAAMRSRVYVPLACLALAAVFLLCRPRHAGTQIWLLQLSQRNADIIQDTYALQQPFQMGQQQQVHMGVSGLQGSRHMSTESAALQQSGSADSFQLLLSPQPDWMSQCCMHKKLRDLYLPGTHDSGTGYPWTTPKHLPFVLDEMAALLFSIMSDLSRTQRLTVYDQLQAGVRVLDLRLAVNPWIAVQQRLEGSASRTSSTVARALNNKRSLLMQPSHSPEVATHGSSTKEDVSTSTARAAAAAASAVTSQGPSWFQIHPDTLEGSLNYTAVGGPLTAAEMRGAVVISHSLPGVRLRDLLADVSRWLAEYPKEVLTILVKADTIDVNVAASQRMTPTAWAAAADVFREQLQGVQLLSRKQVEQQTLAEIVYDGPQGSVLLYSTDLQQHGLPEALTSTQLEILESWGNGTNAEDVPSLTDRMSTWLRFWHDSNWKRNQKPYFLLASAEVTLGVKTILQLLKNRIWMVQQHLQQQQERQGQKAASSPLGKMPFQHVQNHSQHQEQFMKTLQGVSSKAFQSYEKLSEHLSPLAVDDNLAPRLGGMTTLYNMGTAANQQLLQDVLMSDQVHNTFNIWSVDALSSDVVSHVLQLNRAPATS